MKRKNELSKEPINLMPYRLKSEDSLDFISNQNSYKPKFTYEILSSPDNSFSEMIKDFRSRGQESKKIAVTQNDFEGPSSIHIQHDKNKHLSNPNNLKLQNEIRILSIHNSELLSQIEYYRQKIINMESGTNQFQETIWRLQKQLKHEKEKLQVLQERESQLEQENKRLKEDLLSLQSNMRRLKDNRTIPHRSQHDSVRDIKQVYQNISLYLKNRSHQLLTKMKDIPMSPKLQSLLQDFLEQILLINEFTVNRIRKKVIEQPVVEEVEVNVPYSVQRVRLDKSIEKLKQIERQVERSQKQLIERSRGKSMHGVLNPLTEVKSRDRSRSKSARRRIFN